MGCTIALPLHRLAPVSGGDWFRDAVRSVLDQAGHDAELLIILNGADHASRSAAARIAESDARVRVLERAQANLSAALNLALEEARHDLVARMDADDLSLPGRLERQIRFMREHPNAAVGGCAFQRIDGTGRILQTVAPPSEPGRIRWRLLIENVFAHGSVILRRDAVMAAGGYDESCDFAQDYDLWLRLASAGFELGALPDVLYRHRVRPGRECDAPSAGQSAVAARALLRAWSELAGEPEAKNATNPPDRAPAALSAGMPLHRTSVGALAGPLARALGAQRPDWSALADIESVLDEHPTAPGLIAWLYTHFLNSCRERRAAEPEQTSLPSKLSIAV